MAIMKDFPLVHLERDGELRASTEAIALGHGTTHAATIKLVRRYAAEMEQWGEIRFEVRLNTHGKPTEFATLNERQSGFLVSLMRNTAQVVKFKARLITEFADMAESLHNRDLTMWERRIRIEAKDLTSKAKGSMGSKLMLGRKKDIPQIDTERFLLDKEMQPGLLPN